MQPIRINFAKTSALRAILGAKIITWLALAAGIIACASGGIATLRLLSQSDSHQEELQRLQKMVQTRARPAPTRAETILPVHAKAVNDIVSRLNLPWSDVFQSVEAATPATIALLEMSPDPERYAIKGMAEAKTADDMLAYIVQLGQQRFFTSVLLTRHEVNEQDPNKPIRFQFTAEWKRGEQ